MNEDIGARLRAADPLTRDPAMSQTEVEAMRRAIVAAADRSAESPSWFPPLLALVATAAALVIAVVGARMREAPRDAGRRTAATAPGDTSAPASGKRQLQFATPGGTRVIWVFDPEFNP
jgi:hypothetical protein